MPDSEEERALGNLTRANTNFNTITANLTPIVPANEPSKPTTRSFASLMLGKIQKDSEGKKTTLLVSVTPFGGDESLPTAKRPSDKKVNGFANGFSSPSKYRISENTDKNEVHNLNLIHSNLTMSWQVRLHYFFQVTLKSTKKLDVEAKKDDKKEQKYSSGMEKIVDMPLITSSNLISVIQRHESELEEVKDKMNESNADAIERALELGKSDKKTVHVPQGPAIKKLDDKKPKIPVQPIQNSTKIESESMNRAKRSPEISRTKQEGSNKGIELTLTPLAKSDPNEAAESDRSMLARGKDVDKVTSPSIDNKFENLSPSEVRKVEGEAMPTEKKFSFEESRELAGEPDGKADEVEVTEPPALPRSPPPIESRPAVQGEIKPIITTEPRPSFLHGTVSTELKVKPVVPQKPVNFSTKGTASFDGNSLLKKSYVLPPSLVQNTVSRPAQGPGEIEHECLEYNYFFEILDGEC